MQRRASWDALPSTSLVEIFCRTPIKDRFCSLPLVCRSWADVSRNPRCWASMIPAEHSSSACAFDDAFIKHSSSSSSYSRLDSLAFDDPFDGRRSPDSDRGLAMLRSLITRGAGGAAVTSLYFFPFLTCVEAFRPNDDALLRLIAQSCPNLRHLSFHGSYNATEGAILEVMSKCPKLELIDFSDSPYFTPTVLEHMSTCCPDVRGIRRNGFLQPGFASGLAVGFPNLRILNLSGSTIVDKDLLTIMTARIGIQYLDITNCQQLKCYMHIIKRAPVQISQILFD
ncbi:uncharacterized protein LOC113782645 [Coffea eugenioides]|uniref:uncharacterized protein LOC113782645 n=1 Tax=Coffea eugenioides TaxID=49369 RepID=UPI000F6154BF|nr:uncharacterized protein LOC113782645 [Coffea eugenioides]